MILNQTKTLTNTLIHLLVYGCIGTEINRNFDYGSNLDPCSIKDPLAGEELAYVIEIQTI